jgi:hypothetical protein
MSLVDSTTLFFCVCMAERAERPERVAADPIRKSG